MLIAFSMVLFRMLRINISTILKIHYLINYFLWMHCVRKLFWKAKFNSNVSTLLFLEDFHFQNSQNNINSFNHSLINMLNFRFWRISSRRRQRRQRRRYTWDFDFSQNGTGLIAWKRNEIQTPQFRNNTQGESEREKERKIRINIPKNLNDDSKRSSSK